MVEIIKAELVKRGMTTHYFKGTARLDDEKNKKEILDELDKNNFGGCVEIHKTEEEHIYNFEADVYID